MKNLLIVSRSTVYHNTSGGLETQLNGLIGYLKKYYKITVLTTALPFNKKAPIINQTRVINGVTYIFLKDTVPGEYGFGLYESLLWQIPFKRNLNSLNTNFRKKSAEYFEKNLKGNYKLIISQSSSGANFKIDKEKLIAVNHGTTLNEIKSRFKGAKDLKDYIRFIGLNLPTLLYEYFINNPRFFSKCTKIVLVSESLKKDFCRQHKKYCFKCVVIENGVDTKKFKPDPSKYNSKIFKVFYVGRIDFEKGIESFVQIANKLSNAPNIVFDIYGDGPDKEPLIKLIKSSSNKNLHYHGSIDNDTVAKIMAKSHVFLFLTKRKEGLPMSVIESMGSGCIVISPWDLQFNKVYLKFNSTQGAVDELLRLSGGRGLYKEISVNFRRLAEKNFSVKSSGSKYLNLLNRVCD